jgi:hypothetical protein
MDVQGACHCGRITYEAKVHPENVSLCNCTDCQKLTGSAFRLSLTTPKADFRLLTGKPTRYVKTADSGNKRIHAFCPDCGSPVYACADVADPPSYTLRVGCLNQRAQLPPRRRIWCKSALPWVQDLGRIPGVEGQ